MKNSVRNSNIELARIICMFFIFSGHFIGQSGNMVISANVNDYILIFISHFSRIAVNIFLLIGVWFMVDAKYSASRVLKLYFQLVFYCIPITLIMALLFFNDISMKDMLRGILPFWGRALWFASAYITLMLFKPFLDIILTWEKKALSIFICFLLIFISFVSTLPDKQDGYVIDTVWFLIVYLFVGCVKKYPIKIKLPTWSLGVLGLIGYGILASCIFIENISASDNFIIKVSNKLAIQYLNDIKTIPNFLIALLITIWILNLKEHHSLFINYISKSVFTVYIIHQIPVFIPFLWKRVFKSDLWISNHYFWYVILSFIIFYIICSIVDIVRRNVVEPIFVKSKLYKKATVFLDGIVNLY